MNKSNTVKELATYFDQELHALLPITILPGGALGYKDFLVKQLPNGNWGVFNVKNKDLINQYYLKSCALIAAKHYNNKQHAKCYEIKDLDNSYWSNYSDSIIFKHNSSKVSADKRAVLLIRFDESTHKIQYYKKKISLLFKQAFV